MLLIGASPAALHDVGSEKFCGMAVCSQNVNYRAQVLEELAIEATLLTQAIPHPWRPIICSAKDTESFCGRRHYVFCATTSHTNTT